MLLNESHIGVKVRRIGWDKTEFFIPKFIDKKGQLFGVNDEGNGQSWDPGINAWELYQEPPKRVECGFPVYINLSTNEISVSSSLEKSDFEKNNGYWKTIGFASFDPIKGVFYWEE